MFKEKVSYKNLEILGLGGLLMQQYHSTDLSKVIKIQTSILHFDQVIDSLKYTHYLYSCTQILYAM